MISDLTLEIEKKMQELMIQKIQQEGGKGMISDLINEIQEDIKILKTFPRHFPINEREYSVKNYGTIRAYEMILERLKKMKDQEKKIYEVYERVCKAHKLIKEYDIFFSRWNEDQWLDDWF